jgi:hypothetical protein
MYSDDGINGQQVHTPRCPQPCPGIAKEKVIVHAER